MIFDEWQPQVQFILRSTTMENGRIWGWYAKDESVLGHVLLCFQVLLGYIMLGALITRLAILFQVEGPSGDFMKISKTDEKKTEDEIR